MNGREIGWAIIEGMIAGMRPSVKEEVMDFEKIYTRYNVLEEEKKAGLKPEALIKDMMPSEDPWKTMAYAVFRGDTDTALNELKRALEKYKPQEVVDKGLAPGMNAVTKLYDDGVYYLPQVMLSADTMNTAIQYMEQTIGGKIEKKGKIVMHTAEGDIHDLGKNLAKVFLVSSGWDVIDLGRDVPVDDVVKAVEENKPLMVTGTALMTTTMTAFPKIAKKLKEKGIEIPFICGGGAVNEDFIDTFDLGIIAKKAHQGPKYAEAALKGMSWEEIRKKRHEIAPI